MINLFFDYSSIDVVGAEALRDLRNFWRHHLPVGFDVRKVVEHQAPDGDLLYVEETCRFWQVLEWRVIGMEGQRDKGLKAARLVLKSTESHQMIDPVLFVLHMSIEHSCV